MKISQSEGFKPVTITLETRGELAIILASIGETSFNDRDNVIRHEFAEHIDDSYRNTGSEIYEKLKQIFLIPNLKPRNPLIVPAIKRKAGKHRDKKKEQKDEPIRE